MRLGAQALLLAALASGGCEKGPPSASSDAPSATQGAAPEPAVQARDEYREAAFDLVLRPTSPLSAGQPGTVELLLVAKGAYHMNDTYPYRFKVHEGGGLKASSPTYTRESMEFKEGVARLPVQVTAESTGPKTLSGLFLFSVCSAERCLVEKRELQTVLAVN